MNSIKYAFFKFQDIFNLYQRYFNSIPELENEGDIPFFSCSSINYGIKGYFKKELLEDKECLYKPNAICVTNNGSVGFAYYIDTEFTCNTDVTVIYPKNYTLTPNIGNYISTVIMAERFRWCYGRKWKINRMKNSLIRLPVNEYGNIDYQYMESYMESLNIKKLPRTKIEKTNIELNIENWREFKISDLFDVYLSKGDIKEGDCSKGNMPLVSSGSINNGIVEYIDKDGDGIAEIFEKNKITVDMFGQAFYQPNDFYSVSHGRVNILYCKMSNFNKYIALFICCIINSEKFRFSYNRAVYSRVISNLIIKLPSKEIGNKDKNIIRYEPDWQFMEDYIKSLPYSDLI